MHAYMYVCMYVVEVRTTPLPAVAPRPWQSGRKSIYGRPAPRSSFRFPPCADVRASSTVRARLMPVRAQALRNCQRRPCLAADLPKCHSSSHGTTPFPARPRRLPGRSVYATGTAEYGAEELPCPAAPCNSKGKRGRVECAHASASMLAFVHAGARRTRLSARMHEQSV